MDTLKTSSAFKKIQTFSKTNPQILFQSIDDFSTRYTKINNLYLNDSHMSNTLTYGITRQHNYTSNNAYNTQSFTNLDNKSLTKLLNYNQGIQNPQNINFKNYNFKNLINLNFQG